VNVRQSDIAKELNISRVSVSKALRNHPDISKEMKDKICQVAMRMGYIPNLIARQLNSKRTFTIGIVIPDLENSFFSYIANSIIDYAAERNYHVILTVSREKESIERQNIENLIGMRVDGLLVCLSQETRGREIFSTVEKMKIPLVFFDRAPDDMNFSRVIFNDKPGAINSINRIIKEGYTKFACFAGYQTTNIGKQRLDGFLEALNQNKIAVHKEWIIEGGFELKDGYDSFRKLYSRGVLPEIIFAVNDRVALGAYKAAKEAGLNIPEDIGILGYGFSEITDYFEPQLSVINQDPRNMGFEAAKLLITEIESGTEHHETELRLVGEEFLWKRSLNLSLHANRDCEIK
jgi:LacI family transcriptional regulator